MSWAGEGSTGSSGLFVFTEDGSPGELIGSEGQVIVWSDDGAPVFTEQASLTGVEPTSLNQIGDVDTSGVVSGQTLSWNGSDWVPSSAGIGDIVGPSSSTDNAIARWDGTTGKLIQDSNVIIDNSGTITLPGGQIVNGVITTSISYTMQQTDWLVISTAIASRTIFLPSSPTTWQYHNVKDGIGNSKKKNLTIDGNGNSIDGCPEAIINGAYSCYSFVYNGTEWNIV